MTVLEILEAIGELPVTELQHVTKELQRLVDGLDGPAAAPVLVGPKGPVADADAKKEGG